MTLVELFEQSVKKYSNNIAVIYEKKRYTYHEMNQFINKLAQGLKALGIQKGDRVGLFMENSDEYLFSLFAILKCGGVVVPINTFLTEKEVSFIIEDCKASIVFTCKSLYEKIKKSINENDFIRHCIISETKMSDQKVLCLNDIVSKYPAASPDISIEENDLAYIIYTSGTTGHPKGAILTHKNLVSNIEGSIKICEVKPADRIIIILPMFHSFTNTVCILLPISIGARIIIVRSLKPFSRVLKLLLLERITIFVAIPKVFSILAEHDLPWFFKFINPIKLCISGAAPLPGEVLEQFEKKLKIPLLEGYGLTEASPVVSLNPLKGKRKPCSIGLPLHNVKVKIVNEKNEECTFFDSSNNKEELEKAIGEIIVSGPSVMSGYYNKEEATKETIKNSWLYTGDIGYKDEDGYIYIVDRKKDMILVRGMNVYPREIEEILYKHPQIKEVAVVGIKNSNCDELPKAFVVLKENGSATEKELKDFCKVYLAHYKIPHSFEFIADLPKTGTGKILKKELRNHSPQSAQRTQR